MKWKNVKKSSISCICPYCEYIGQDKHRIKLHMREAHDDSEYENLYGDAQ